MAVTDHPTHRPRRIRRTVQAPRRSVASGFELAKLHPSLIDGGMDPFLQIDAFSLAEPVFKPHPHAGFNAVTYLFPNSAGGFINRDTLGGRHTIGPGALHWTAAGRGVQHEEVPEMLGRPATGLQMFIDLPGPAKAMAPRALHLEPEEVPQWRTTGVTARVVLGQCNGLSAALEPPTPNVLLLDVTLDKGAVFDLTVNEDDNVFVWVVDGQAQLEDVAQEHPLSRYDFAGLDPHGTRVRISGGSSAAHLIIAGGHPLRQPVHAEGPFVLDTPTALQQAKRRYAAGDMGWLAQSRYGDDGRPVMPSAVDVRLAT